MLLCWLQMRALGGALVLRIEDVDRARTRPGAEEKILTDLRWLGFDWDEGPDVGGSFGPYRQSERADLYADALRQLEDRSFECSCTRKDIRAAAGVSKKHRGELRYSGACRLAPQSPERPQRTLRVRVDPEELHWDDLWCGLRSESPDLLCGDFILWTKAGDPSYQLACSVDDRAMEISHILRGEDLALSTGRQLLLHRWLAGDYSPLFAHTPLRLDSEGLRLAKRRGSLALARHREAGDDPQLLLGELALDLGLVDDEGLRLSPKDLLGPFAERMPQLLRRF
jgi:glutamyl-tRNA synthetase